MFSQSTLCSQESPEQISWPVNVVRTSPKVKPYARERWAMAVLRWSEASLIAFRLVSERPMQVAPSR